MSEIVVLFYIMYIYCDVHKQKKRAEQTCYDDKFIWLLPCLFQSVCVSVFFFWFRLLINCCCLSINDVNHVKNLWFVDVEPHVILLFSYMIELSVSPYKIICYTFVALTIKFCWFHWQIDISLSVNYDILSPKLNMLLSLISIETLKLKFFVANLFKHYIINVQLLIQLQSIRFEIIIFLVIHSVDTLHADRSYFTLEKWRLCKTFRRTFLSVSNLHWSRVDQSSSFNTIERRWYCW